MLSTRQPPDRCNRRMGSTRTAVFDGRWQERARSRPASRRAPLPSSLRTWGAREGQREASLDRIGAIIPPWRGVLTGNSPCSRTAILAWPSQLTGPTRASQRTLVRAPPSAKRPAPRPERRRILADTGLFLTHRAKLRQYRPVSRGGGGTSRTQRRSTGAGESNASLLCTYLRVTTRPIDRFIGLL